MVKKYDIVNFLEPNQFTYQLYVDMAGTTTGTVEVSGTVEAEDPNIFDLVNQFDLGAENLIGIYYYTEDTAYIGTFIDTDPNGTVTLWSLSDLDNGTPINAGEAGSYPATAYLYYGIFPYEYESVLYAFTSLDIGDFEWCQTSTPYTTWSRVSGNAPDWFDSREHVVFNNYMYTLPNDSFTNDMWRMDWTTKSGDWHETVGLPTVGNSGIWFEDTNNLYVMRVFGANGGDIWKTSDGTNWSLYWTSSGGSVFGQFKTKIGTTNYIFGRTNNTNVLLEIPDGASAPIEHILTPEEMPLITSGVMGYINGSIYVLGLPSGEETLISVYKKRDT